MNGQPMDIYVRMDQFEDTMRGYIQFEGKRIHEDSIVGITPDDKLALLAKMKTWMEENHPGWDGQVEGTSAATAEPADLAAQAPAEPTELPPMPKSTIPLPPVTYPPIKREVPEFHLPNSFA